MEDLKGGDAQLNATILRDVFGGAKGPVADALNLVRRRRSRSEGRCAATALRTSSS